jgi:Flp pilus assembly protein TadD
MNARRLLLFSLVVLFVSMVSNPAFAQDDQEDQPHITPRREERQKRPQRPASTPQPSSSEALPTGPPPQPPATRGESSSKDSQIDFNAGPAPSAPENPASESVNYDPHRAAKDIEVGNYYLRQKNYRAALERFHDALLYKPEDAEATYGLAVTQERMDLFSLAYNNYSKYTELFPEGPKAKDAEEGRARVEAHLPPEIIRSNTGRMAAEDLAQGEKYLARNEYAAARQSFERALRLTPDNPAISFRLGQSLEGLQQLDAARMYYNKYLELQPNGPFAAVAKKNIAGINDMIGK